MYEIHVVFLFVKYMLYMCEIHVHVRNTPWNACVEDMLYSGSKIQHEIQDVEKNYVLGWKEKYICENNS